jgi:RNA polymerase sigma-70 factor (ECF subfamily)
MHPDDRLAEDRLAEELAQSASALRSLARDLTGRGDDADDLVQETMLRAWRSPPPERRGLRPWLATILRNLASNQRRDERRRKAREQEHGAAQAAAAGGPNREPETLRAVTEALWQLPEPYQRALTLRYFAGRTPGEIAAGTGTPLATVKSRLRRGLQLLRERLERDHGRDWREALCAATGLPLAGTGVAAATTASVLLMAHTTKILFGAAAIAVVTWLLWPTDDAAPPQATRLADTDATSARGALATDAAPAPIEREEALRATRSDAVDLLHPFEFRLRCRVLDRDGLRIRDAGVAIGPAGGRLNRWLEPTGATGEVTLTWRARVPTMTVQVGLMFVQSAQGLRELRVHADAPNEVVLLHADGANANLCQAARMSSSQDCTTCHTAGTGNNRLFDAALLAKSDLHPFGRFQDSLLGDTGTRRPDFVMRPPPPPFGDYFLPEEQKEPDETSAIRGVVRDAQGRPVAGATVAWGLRPDMPEGRTKTKADGSYSLSFVIPGKLEVRAGGGADGIARRTVDVVADTPRTVDLYLAQDRTLTGRVLLPDDAKADGWRVEYRAVDTFHADGAVLIGNDFTLANLTSQQGSMLLWSPRGRLPAVHLAEAFPGAPVTFDLTMQGLPAGALHLQLPDEVEHAHNVEAFVYQLATGRGAMMTRREGRYQLGELPPGRYRVGLSGPQIGVLDLGVHQVDGQSIADLGMQQLPEPGLLRIDRPNPDARLELFERRPELDVLAAPVRQGQLEFLLPRGEWLLLWGDPAAPQARTVTVGASPASVQLR